jgi:hypothetical protein
MFTGEICNGVECPAFDEKGRGVSVYGDLSYIGTCLMVPSKNSTGTQEKKKEKK